MKRILGITSPLLLALLTMISITAWASSAEKHTPLDNGTVRPPFSSSCIHKHWEGVILPLNGQPGDIRLQTVTLEAHSTFFSCMVRNFIIQTTAVFTLENSSAESVSAYSVGFPFSTHALYGDHNELRDIRISVAGITIPFQVALDHSLYEIRDQALFCKGRAINSRVHPLISDTTDIHDLSPFLAQQGFDMLAYWQMDFAPHEHKVVQIEYTNNSNDFSDCCRQVKGSTYGASPHYFYFDLSNAAYWQHPTDARISLYDTLTAIWSAAPQLDLHRTCDATGIEFQGENVWLTQDLAAPVQPNVFWITPRCWPSDEVLQQELVLQWIDYAYYFTNTEIYEIVGTPGVTIEDVELPLTLSDESPTASLTLTLDPAQLSDPAYVDIYGKGTNWSEGLYRAFVRVPITGHAVVSHDLALTGLGVSGPWNFGQAATATARVENKGMFDESSVQASLYVEQSYVKSAVFPGLNAGAARQIALSWTQSPTSTDYFLEIEIEPVPGETKRQNNVARTLIMTTLPPPAVYLPLALRTD